jgi:hypothetical protein
MRKVALVLISLLLATLAVATEKGTMVEVFTATW